MRKVLTAIVTAMVLAVMPMGAAVAGPRPPAQPGAAGIGDPYFPKDGNGGYDVQHYDLTLAYDPKTHRLVGSARIEAVALQRLSAFHLDFVGLSISELRVNGMRTRWERDGQELTVTPGKPLRKGASFVVTVAYQGKPTLLNEPALGKAGVFPTGDGALIAGEPHVAATWFPVNDHPLDKASMTFRVTVPRGVEVVANGRLAGQQNTATTTTWTWEATDPMAPYLATAAIGQFDVRSYVSDGITFWDAIDVTLFETPKPRSGTHYLASGTSDAANYQRLTRTISVPKSGGRLTFKAYRGDDFSEETFIVEAHRVGFDNWTTLKDRNGHTTQDTGQCPFWLDTYPFLKHYQTKRNDEECRPSGTTGSWNQSDFRAAGWENWSVDLKAFKGQKVEIALSMVTDFGTGSGVLIDNVVGPKGQGSTSFEPDSSPLDGWKISGPPPGSPPNMVNWAVRTPAEIVSTGDVVRDTLAMQPEVLRFLSGIFGPYPFAQGGGIVDNDPGLGFALENQTRPIYAKGFFDGASPDQAVGVVVHESAHQWVGDDVSVAGWKDIWLNEGFATYAEWLWAEHKGEATTKQIGAGWASIPSDDEEGEGFWATTIGDPGPDGLFDFQVYYRGALTLEYLRQQVGDPAFFTILKRWTTERAGGNGTTSQFIDLAEQVSGQDLEAFFTVWLFTPSKPAGLPEVDELRTTSVPRDLSVRSLASHRKR